MLENKKKFKDKMNIGEMNDERKEILKKLLNITKKN
jgi:hypothetical protein